MIDVFRLTEAMKDLWGASGTEIEKRERLLIFQTKHTKKISYVENLDLQILNNTYIAPE